jgi:hypothetical protein
MDILQAQFVLSVLTFLLAVSGAIVAWRTYLRSERWKEAEFVAREMKEFFGDERVHRVLLLVDWGLWRIQLLEQSAENGGVVVVDRALQVRALRPHVLLVLGSDEIGTGRFTPAEAAIRDHYDAFLDGLERFGNFLKTKLVRVETLRPYIGYWIEDIHSESATAPDAAWTAALMTYSHFYRFRGVQYLFQTFGNPIGPDSIAYRRALDAMEDRDLAGKLLRCVSEASGTVAAAVGP